MIGWTGAEVLTWLTSIGFGLLSGVVPVANAEAYVVASQVSALAGAVPVAVGVAFGQTAGKVLLFLSVRRGRRSFEPRGRRPFEPRPPKPESTGPAGPVRWRSLRARIRRLVEVSLRLVGHPRWGLPVVFAASLLGLPPLYPVALLAGATPIRLAPFVAVVLVGRVARFVAVALGVGRLMFVLG